MHIHFQIQKDPKGVPFYLCTDSTQLENLLNKQEILILQQQIKNDLYFLTFYRAVEPLHIIYLKEEQHTYTYHESIRKAGVQAQAYIASQKYKEIAVINLTNDETNSYLFTEGLVMANYQFLPYKSDHKKLQNNLQQINFPKGNMSTKALQKLKVVLKAIYYTRDLVNEPNSFMTATQLANEIKKIGKEGMVKVNVLTQQKIEQLGMGGLLAVNKGSTEPATFTIIEHKPLKYKNKQPIILVGKGVVYDTGGLSLKPTPNSMDKMKSDMGGAALVTGIMYTIGSLDLPLHVIALIPATDNRPGGNAYAPGDVIKMMSGTTVEVLNTDAEGRMILADALHYAKKYQPELVMDFATLTGAASAAFGDVAMVSMGKSANEAIQTIQEIGFQQNEKVVELPLWDDYGALIKSDVADIKNIGGPQAGAITAGKFLEVFTDYPWIHFDIAGVTFRDNKKGYWTSGATAFGLRTIVDFFIEKANR